MIQAADLDSLLGKFQLIYPCEVLILIRWIIYVFRWHNVVSTYILSSMKMKCWVEFSWLKMYFLFILHFDSMVIFKSNKNKAHKRFRYETIRISQLVHIQRSSYLNELFSLYIKEKFLIFSSKVCILKPGILKLAVAIYHQVIVCFSIPDNLFMSFFLVCNKAIKWTWHISIPEIHLQALACLLKKT